MCDVGCFLSSSLHLSWWGNHPGEGQTEIRSVEFLRALGSQSGVSVWQHIYFGRLAVARSFIR